VLHLSGLLAATVYHRAPPEPTGDVKTTVLLPAALHQRLRLAAVMGHRTAREIVLEALVAWLDGHEA